MQQVVQQVMQLIEQQSQKGAQQLQAQEHNAQALTQYDQQVRQTLGGLEQAGGAMAQGLQQILAQQAQVAQALTAAVERLNAAPVMQNAEAINVTLAQVAQGFQAVIEAVQAPKDVEFVAGKDGVPRGARMKSTRAAPLQQAANEVAAASNTVAAIEAMETRQTQAFERLIATMQQGLGAIIAAVERPKRVDLQRDASGRVAGAVATVQ